MAQQTTITTPILKQVKLYIEQVKHANIPITQTIVFGSHAKGTAHKWSDIDICIVSPYFGKKNGFDELMELTHLKNNQTIDIEAHPMHPNDLNNKYDTLATEIRKYGITV